MIEENAVVTEKLGNRVTLEIERRTACGLCGQKRGCGNATWGKMLGHKTHAFSAENEINAVVGDAVVVGIDERAILSSVFYLYVVPLITMFATTILADFFIKNQFYVIVSAIVGLLLGFVWVKGHLSGLGDSGVIKQMSHEAIILRYANDVTDANHFKKAHCSAAVSPISNVVNVQTKRGE